MDQFGKSGEPLYAALIGDVVESRRVVRRRQFQSRLQGALEGLNGRLEAALAAPLVLTAGDEIQGLFRLPAQMVTVVVDLAEELHPVHLVYGLGYGELTTELLAETARMDGPCFHRARRALEAVDKKVGWVTAAGFGDNADLVLSTCFDLMGAVRSRWTSRQVEYVRQVRRTKWQKDVAAKFGVSPSVVSESLKAAAYAAVRRGEDLARSLLEEFGSPIEAERSSVSEVNLLRETK